MSSRTILFIAIVLLFGCQTIDNEETAKLVEDVITIEEVTVAEIICGLEDSICAMGLVDVQILNPQIFVNLRYSGVDNFLKQDLYGCLTNAYLQPQVALMLDKAQEVLTQKDSGLRLLVWDAVRPRSVQWKMWEALHMPFDEKKRYVSNPRNGSIHNFGCAVDLTICDSNGVVLDMGTDFDFFGRAANTRYEYSLLQEGVLNKVQFDNRRLLRMVMKSVGFQTISSEWWHFNAMSRSAARSQYAIVE